jgi:hypothetical protein
VSTFRRVLLTSLLSIVVAVPAAWWVTARAADSAANSMLRNAPVVVGTEVEVLLTDEQGTEGGVEPVYSQCDRHGHRVFASRHPIHFQVVEDLSCPGGER